MGSELGGASWLPGPKPLSAAQSFSYSRYCYRAIHTIRLVSQLRDAKHQRDIEQQ